LLAVAWLINVMLAQCVLLAWRAYYNSVSITIAPWQQEQVWYGACLLLVQRAEMFSFRSSDLKLCVQCALLTVAWNVSGYWCSFGPRFLLQTRLQAQWRGTGANLALAVPMVNSFSWSCFYPVISINVIYYNIPGSDAYCISTCIASGTSFNHTSNNHDSWIFCLSPCPIWLVL